MNFMQAKTMGIVSNRLPSETIFAFDLNVNYIFGVPRSVSSGGLVMDADRNITTSKALDGDNNKKVQFQLAIGMDSSALEHSVPEQMFSTTENPVQGISAVKALQIANDQGIPIYTINQANINSILPQLQLYPDTIEAIQNAVNAGKEVRVSKTNIIFYGWTGCGYIIIDPATGEGGYMLSGGLSGSDTQADKSYWSVFDTLFSLLGVKNTILGELIKSDMFGKLNGVIGIFGALINLIVDANQILSLSNVDLTKKAASLTVLIATSGLVMMAGFLTLGIAGGPLFTVLATTGYMIAITAMLNFIKILAIEAILQASWDRKRNLYAYVQK